jgi:hypothetical protein
VAAVATGLRPVALVDQYEDVRIVVDRLAVLQRRVELVDDRGDQWVLLWISSRR